MSWLTPKTWINNELVTAAMLNQEIRDRLLDLWKVQQKGDLLVAIGPADIVRLPVGANGYVLEADSTQTSGMKWGNKGVTNGNSHDHSGGDGGTIAHSSLSGTGSATGHVTNGDSHDHAGGDGAQIPTAGIADDAITNAKIGAGAVGSTEIASSAVTEAKIANNAVTYAKMAIKIQKGQGSWTGSAASSGYITVTFATAFASTPSIVPGFTSGFDSGTSTYRFILLGREAASASGFEVFWKTADGGNVTAVSFDWVAIL